MIPPFVFRKHPFTIKRPHKHARQLCANDDARSAIQLGGGLFCGCSADINLKRMPAETDAVLVEYNIIHTSQHISHSVTPTHSSIFRNFSGFRLNMIYS